MTTKSPAATLAEIAESLKRREAELTGQPAPAAGALDVATVQAFVRDLDRTPKSPVTWFDLALAFLTLQRAVVALSQRCAQLEAAPKGLAYRGVWTVGETYAKDEGVTFQGSLWVAKTATTQPPGTDDWQLCAKRGKDGKDAR